MKKVLAILAVVILFGACKKSSSTTDDNTKIGMLSRKWKLTASVVTYSYQPGQTDDYASMSVCDKDNISEYKATGTYNLYSSTVKCSASEPDILDAGTWSLQDNETKLKIQSNSFATPFIYDIITLTKDTYTIKYTEVRSFGNIYTTSTFVAVP